MADRIPAAKVRAYGRPFARFLAQPAARAGRRPALDRPCRGPRLCGTDGAGRSGLHAAVGGGEPRLRACPHAGQAWPLASAAVDAGVDRGSAVVDPAVRPGGDGFGHSPGGGRAGRWRRPGAPRLAGRAARIAAQDRAGVRRPAGRAVDRPRRSDGAGGCGCDAACPALVVAGRGDRCARPDRGRCCCRHRGRLQHTAGRRDLRARAAVAAAQPVAQLARHHQHRPCRLGRHIGVRQHHLLRKAARTAARLVFVWSWAAGRLGRRAYRRTVLAARRSLGAGSARPLQPLAARLPAALCGRGAD